MYVDSNHEGLKKYRAHRAEKKVVALLALEYAKEHPKATKEECKAAALAIREEQLRVAEEAKSRPAKKQKRKQKSHKKSVDMDKVKVVVVNKVEQ